MSAPDARYRCTLRLGRYSGPDTAYTFYCDSSRLSMYFSNSEDYSVVHELSPGDSYTDSTGDHWERIE